MHKWDTLTGEALILPIVMDTEVYLVAISKDGTLIVTTGNDFIGYDHTVRRWDAWSWKAIGEPITLHSEIVLAIVISDNGKLILSGSRNGKVRWLDTATGEAIGELMEHSSWFLDCFICSDCVGICR